MRQILLKNATAISLQNETKVYLQNASALQNAMILLNKCDGN